MSDDVTAVLAEIATLLRQRIAQSEEMAKRSAERMARMPDLSARMAARMPDFAVMEAKHEAEAKERHDEKARRRSEDVEFRERLLAALDRQNELLTRLVDRKG